MIFTLDCKTNDTGYKIIRPTYRQHVRRSRRLSHSEKKYFSTLYPADSIVEISSLFHPEALIEIEDIAVKVN